MNIQGMSLWNHLNNVAKQTEHLYTSWQICEEFPPVTQAKGLYAAAPQLQNPPSYSNHPINGAFRDYKTPQLEWLLAKISYRLENILIGHFIKIWIRCSSMRAFFTLKPRAGFRPMLRRRFNDHHEHKRISEVCVFSVLFFITRDHFIIVTFV